MKRAINEIQGMVLKAARGAGVPLGIAEDLSDCVPFALAENALNDIADILNRGEFSSLIGDIAMLDSQICGRPGSRVPHMPAGLFRALCAARGMGTQPDVASGPQTISETHWVKLAKLAALTYVPATETSRVSGAGADLSDND
ncbi:MAG: DUF3726 domain-containing protein [Rhodobacteraceae bacterium]|nr:DUF3726 domain-containing protein [Paracoccaceae bacterium]